MRGSSLLATETRVDHPPRVSYERLLLSLSVLSRYDMTPKERIYGIITKLFGKNEKGKVLFGITM